MDETEKRIIVGLSSVLIVVIFVSLSVCTAILGILLISGLKTLSELGIGKIIGWILMMIGLMATIFLYLFFDIKRKVQRKTVN